MVKKNIFLVFNVDPPPPPLNGAACLLCCVFVNCLVKQFAICLGIVVILLLNAMEVLSVGGDVWSPKECVCCASDPNVHLGVPFIGFVYVCVCRK